VVHGPADGVEYGDGVEVVTPVRDLSVSDRDDGDKVVIVGVPGTDRSAVDGVFEDDNGGVAVPVDGQFVGAVPGA
jgi:hypothetical protein